MDLSVIVVNYNVRDYLAGALASAVRALRGMQGEIIVVDNASDDGSAEMVREKYPEVVLVAGERNVGFAAANNIGLRRARGRYLLLLNPDTVVQEDTFQEIVRFLDEHPAAGMAGCRILNPDGTLQPACRRSFPTPWVAFTKISGLSALFPRSRVFGRYNLGYLDPDRTHEVDAVSGSFMAVRREAYEQAGGLDEQYFLYGEDLDWCYAIKRAGWQIWYVSGTRIVHYKGESVRRSGIDEVRTFYRAMRIFVGKHHGRNPLNGLILRAGISLREWAAFLGRAAGPLRDAALDLALMAAAWLAAEQLWFGEIFRFPGYAYPITLLVPWAVVAAVGHGLGAYTVRRRSPAVSAASVVAGYVLLSALTFFFRDYAFSRMVVLLSGALNIVVLPGWRMLAAAMRRRSSPGGDRRSLVIGADDAGRDVVRRLRSMPRGGYDVIGFIDVTSRRIGERVDGVEILGSIDNIAKIIQQEKVSEVIVSTDALSYKEILSVIAKAGNRSVSFRLVPTSLEVIIGKTRIDSLSDLPFVRIEYGLNRPANRALKRLLDLAAGGLLYVTLYPFRRGNGAGRTVLAGRIGDLPKVLRGRMSLVGPTGGAAAGQRNGPEGPGYLGKPGLVSLADLNGRAGMPSDERERYDVYYAKNQSILLDIEILAKSLRAVS